MPPIEMTMSPVDDKICIDIPKRYRSYSFAVTLTPVKRGAAGSRRMTRRGVKSEVEMPVYTKVRKGCKWLVDPSITCTAELLELCEGEDRR